jgi:4-alpha-glucanotransferase/alpha-amylase
MTDPVTLLFGVHAHQPAGNFPEVIDHAHERCYGPFLRTMADYPEFRFAVHFSGPLLDDLATRYPDDIELLGRMVARGQVEMFGAGDAEPVLAAIPYRDRVSQIDALSAKLARRFGQTPRGAWLTERVWESSVVPALARCGIRYATVDDYHFLCAGQPQHALDRHFTTEEDGHTLDIFPISEALRYRIPFAPAADAVAYVESLAMEGRAAAAIYFDDIEKLGVWPETFEWVYGRRWLRDFVEGVLASSRIRTSTFADHHARSRTGGIVYLPTTSYIEMNEWTLPAGPAGDYATLVAEEKAAGRYDTRKGFLRGGIWRNFMSRYPEANWMHKRMLGLSERLAALPPGPARDELRPLLHLAQANDAYWHGLFGGLYLPHLRRGVWRHLLLLESALDRVAPRPPSTRADLDHDGVDELLFSSADAQVAVRLDGCAAVAEIDGYRLAQNFGDTLRRHPEHYHAKARDGAESAHGGGGIASAHDRVTFKHEIAPEELVADVAPRHSFRDRWRAAGGEAVALASYAQTRAGAASVAFELRSGAATIAKSIALDGATVTVRYQVLGGMGGRLATTIDLAMPSCDGVAGRYLVGGSVFGGFGQPLDLGAASEVVLDDRHMGGSIALRTDPPARITARPYHTVSQSEEGFERVMQSATLEVEWAVRVDAESFVAELTIRPDPQ